MTYRDMTFCKYYKECTEGKDCFRALTPTVVKEARKWWGEYEAPVCMFAEHPDCFKQKTKDWLTRKKEN